jgi:ATP-dependent Clp protease ATP-binding subunit ClpA
MSEPTDSNNRINEVIARAFQEAISREHEYVTLEHILQVMLDEEDIKDILSDLHANTILLKDDVSDWLRDQEEIRVDGMTKPRKTAAMERCFNRAYTQAIFTGRGHMEPLDLLISIAAEKTSYANYFLLKHGINKDMLLAYLGRVKDGRSKESKAQKKRDGEKILSKFTTNLIKSAKEDLIDPLIGREQEVFYLAKTLSRKKKNNVIMVGDPGVGKTAIVEGLAVAIEKDLVPAVLKGKTIYSLDMGRLLAGTRFRGDFEERMQQVLEALQDRKDAILFIDEIHMIMGAGSAGAGSMDVANMLKPALEKGQLRCIGSTTYEEFRENFESDRALLRRFTKVDIVEPTPEETKLMLRQVIPLYSKYHGIECGEAVIDTAVDLSMKYMLDKKLPDKAIDILDAGMARIKVQASEEVELTLDHIRLEISELTRIPIEQLGEHKDVAVNDLESLLRTTVFGQNEAIETVMNSVYIANSGLKEVNRPMGNFLFVGPTGTGKTELCIQLADGMGMELIRFDMSEYKEPHKIASLIGSPPGYVGYGEGKAGSGKLINELERVPNCVLLFDEIEKAHTDVIQVLLGLMDNGIITGSDNKQVSGRNAFVIMTSNLGARDGEKNLIGFGEQGQNDSATDIAVKNFFAPEFRNRLDSIVKFNRIDKTVVNRIAEKFMTQIRIAMAENGQTLVYTDKVLDYIASEGFSDTMGARPMKRLIDKEIKLDIAKSIIKSGKTEHVIDVLNGRLIVK